MNSLQNKIDGCDICKGKLPFDPKPVVSFSSNSKVIVVGQAPGLAVQQSAVPWDDKSGENLRTWLGVSNYVFYDSDIFGIVPMGFCYPGKGRSGDLPPMKICAQTWHKDIFEEMNQIKLILLIGQYAQKNIILNRK